MASVFEKLNLKNQRDIVVVNAPASFESELRRLAGIAVRRRMPAGSPVEFALVFATEQGEVDAAAAQLAKVAPGDAVVWFAYPKGTSQRYTCGFNRDDGWKALGRAGFEPVRQIAIGSVDEYIGQQPTDVQSTLRRVRRAAGAPNEVAPTGVEPRVRSDGQGAPGPRGGSRGSW